MKTIYIVLEKQLLRAIDRVARQTKQSRSALIGDAVREHLRRLEIRAQEEGDRQGYSKQPVDQSSAWEVEAAWPAD